MQQYFIDKAIKQNDCIVLDDDILHHFKKVLREKDGFKFRVADKDGHFYNATLSDNKAIINQPIEEYNELKVDVTVLLSLISSDKWDMAIQKMTELGVKRIVPFIAKRSQFRNVDFKKIDRYRRIVKEAACQSHRNYIPEITEAISIKDIDKYKSKNNYIAYEKEKDGVAKQFDESVTIVIGPEGGFDIDEVNEFISHGFKTITFGNSILRAETAAIYALALVSIKQ